jgi:hypothetical protein
VLPTQPPRDADGEVTPHDHPDIKNQDGIIRRVASHHIVVDPKAVGGHRPSSSLFNPSSGKAGGVSIDLQRPIEEAGMNSKGFVSNPPWLGAIILKAQDFRTESLIVGYDPVPENPYHGQVWGNFTGATKKKLLGLAAWYVQIPNDWNANK